MTILVLDGYNLLHRARSGFTLGEHFVAFNFFRGLRPLVDKFKPSRVYMVLEGKPKRQLALLPEYKANRDIDVATDPAAEAKLAALQDFWRQKFLVVGLLKAHFPISVVCHPDFEGDDVVANLVRSSSSTADFVVVSTDTDFIQLLQCRTNVKLYNPVQKRFVEAPADYDYVVWKALRGDPTDNIPGLMTDAKAREAAVLFNEGALTVADLGPEFDRNRQLIQLHDGWSPDEALQLQSSSPIRDWDAVRTWFDAWGFKSMTKEGAWEKFILPFEALWP